MTKVRTTIEKYSQSTSVALKNSILSVMNRQIGYLKGFENTIRSDKKKFLAPGVKPSKNLPNSVARPFITESSKLFSGVGPDKTSVEIQNWSADNYFCGERNEEGAFYDLILLVVFTDIAIQQKMIKDKIPPEVNLEFMKPNTMDMILFSDNEMKPTNGRVMYKWSSPELLAVHSVASSRAKHKKSATFFTGGHFELFGKNPLSNLGIHNLEVLVNNLYEDLWKTFEKHYL